MTRLDYSRGEIDNEQTWRGETIRVERVACGKVSMSAFVVLLVAIAAAFPTAVAATEGDVGFRGPSFNGGGVGASGSKPESKLWWNDGFWSASMWDTATQDFHIFKLDEGTGKWLDTRVALDDRAGSRADVLWDGTHLYVASHIFATAAASGSPSRLYRFSYNPATDSYTLDAGFPVSINNYRTETLVLDKDSTGKLWATWIQDNRVYVNRTNGSDTSWGTPFTLPVAGAAALDADDISSLVAFGGNKIGVMWSNQNASAMYFAIHVDGDEDTSWQASRTAVQGPNEADDHINLKSLQADGTGRVFAVTKSSHNDASPPNPNAPLIRVLVRDAASGDWASHVFGRVADGHTRPIMVLDSAQRLIHVFATAPEAGGTIYRKTTPIDSISFATGIGTPFIHDAASVNLNNATSTKQTVNGTTGLVVVATNDSTGFYWHGFEPLGPSPPPTASFSGAPTSGAAPLTVAFSDRSTGSPTTWLWNFGDGSSSTQQHPTHTYASTGAFTVTLTVSNGSGTDVATRADYITVTPPQPDFSLSASPSSRTIARGEGTTYTVVITPQQGFSGVVDLSVAGLPVGATGTFSPEPVNVSASTSSVLTITTTPTAKNGTYSLSIAGTSGGVTRTTSTTLQIKRK